MCLSNVKYLYSEEAIYVPVTSALQLTLHFRSIRSFYDWTLGALDRDKQTARCCWREVTAVQSQRGKLEDIQRPCTGARKLGSEQRHTVSTDSWKVMLLPHQRSRESQGYLWRAKFLSACRGQMPASFILDLPGCNNCSRWAAGS